MAQLFSGEFDSLNDENSSNEGSLIVDDTPSAE
jgi:hypothetical protein